MLLALYNYATRLLNSMTTTLAAAAAATITGAHINSTTASTRAAAAAATNTSTRTTATSSKATAYAMLPEQQQQQLPAPTEEQQLQSESQSTPSPPLLQHSLDTFNATLKTLFNKTLANVANTNLSDYTTPYTLLPQLSNATAAASSNSSSAAVADLAAPATLLPPLPATRHYIETSTFPAQTVATFIAGNKNRATTIIVYPTVSPESIVIPIVSCIFGFPILALIVICCLRRRAKLARERDRRRNYDMQDHAVSLVRFSPIHRLNYRSSRAISLRPERSLSQGFTSLELDTVVEERGSDVEQTQTEILNAESPMETTSSYKMSFSS